MTDQTITNNLLCKHYEGELAYIDSFSGLIKCKVESIVYQTNEISGLGKKACRVKVTQKNRFDGDYYVTGHTYTIASDYVIPRKHVYVSSGHDRIRNNYTWIKERSSAI